MEYGWSGSGQYLTAPIVALSTELNGLASSPGDLLAVSAPFANALGAVYADVEFIAGGACSPAQDAFIEVWILRSLDGGVSFEDGSATLAPARTPDLTIAVEQGTSIIPHSGAPGLLLPPGTFKIALRNQMGVAIPTGSTLRFAEYGEAGSEDGLAGMAGDATGTTAHRIADMLEKFGVITYSQADISSNPWLNNTSSDYTTTSVIAAINWLTANSGMHINVREYHLAGYDTGNGSNQLSWCPQVANATGAKFSVSIKNGGGVVDAATLASMASLSASGSGWLSWAEGLNTPNDGSVTAANCVATQQAIYTGCAATRAMPHPVAAVGPSFTYNTLPPETSTAISTYLTAQQKSDLLTSSSLASVRFFPALNPEANDAAGRTGNADDIAIGHQIYFSKPAIVGEWHPTSANTDSPSHATDDGMAAYYAVLGILNFHRLGYEAWFWKSLFDIGQSGDSPWVRVGLFPNGGSDTPRLPARTIRAMYSLTGDTGTSKRSFNTSKLDFSVSGLAAPPASATPWMGGHTRLFQNSGGTFFLFVWNERLAPATGATNVTVTFARTMGQVTVYDLTTNPLTAETAVQTLTNTNTTTLSIAGSVYLFVIVPQGSTVPLESAQGTTVISTAGALYDAIGIAFVLVTNPPYTYQVNHGGITDSQNVVLLLYYNHRVYQQTSTNAWSYWTGSAWVVVAGDPRGTVSESPDGMTITGPGTTIYASQTPGQTGGAPLDLWTIDASARAVVNGTLAGSTSNVMELYYHLHIVYVEQTVGNAYGTPGWSQWNGSTWTDCASPIGAQESLEGTTVTTVGPAINASQTMGVPAGAALDTFAINLNGQAVFNGVADTTRSTVNQLYIHEHVVYQRASDGNVFGKPGWWSWTGSTWAATPSPIALVESTQGTTISAAGEIIYASQTPGSSPGVSLDAWLITESGYAARNNVTDLAHPSVILLYYSSHYVYLQAQGTNGIGDTPGWWRRDVGGWTAVHTPIVKSMALSGIGQQIVGQAFVVAGTTSGYGTPAALQYRDNVGGYVTVSTTAPLINDEFTSGPWMTHQTWASGDVWEYGVAGSPGGATNGSTTWWVNPIATPSTASLFSMVNGSLRLGVMVNPGGLGIAEHTLGTIINNFNAPGGCYRVFGYHELVVAVPRVNGFMFGFDIEDHFPGVQDGWNVEINIYIWTDSGGVSHVWFQAVDALGGALDLSTGGVTLYSTTSLDISMPNTLAIDWQPNFLRCFINGVQVGSSYVTPGGLWQTAPMGTYIYTNSADYQVGDGVPDDGTLPQHATLYSYKVYPTKPNVNELYQSTTAFSFLHPSVSTAQSMTVGLRDASDGTVTATSNSFQVLATGGVTLTRMTLSGKTVIAGALAGAPIGTIAVTATGGTFNGTFDVSDKTHFRIVGNTLYNATTLTAGTYSITISATMLGAAGSPLEVTFPDITATTGGNASINFAAPTGKVLSKSLFGVSVNAIDGLQYFGNSTFRSTANTYLKPALLHVHPDWELPRNYGIGNMVPVNTFLSNYRSFCQNGIRVIMGCGGYDGATAKTYTASQHASWVTSFANYLNANGYGDILDWEVGFEWGYTGVGVSLTDVVTYFNQIADALHSVNSSYRVWGPPQAGPNSYDTASFANQVGTRCYGILYHSYDIASNTTGQITDPLDVVYGSKGVNSQTAVTQRAALVGTPLASAPIAVLEYNMAYSFVGGNYVSVDTCGQYVGAIWAANLLIGLFQSTTGVEAAALKSLVGSGDFGTIVNAQLGSNPAAIDAQGYFLGKAGQSLYGPEYVASTTVARLVIIAVKPTSTTYAICLVNYDQVSDATVNLSLTGGAPSGTISRWQIGKGASYAYPGSGSFRDAYNNLWSLNSSGNPVVNTYTDVNSHAQSMLLTGGVVWQEDVFSGWYSFTPGGAMVASPQDLWAGPAVSAPSVATPAPVVSTQAAFGSVSVASETIVILTGNLA